MEPGRSLRVFRGKAVSKFRLLFFAVFATFSVLIGLLYILIGLALAIDFIWPFLPML